MLSISVVIPAYNSGEFLSRCLEALKESSDFPDEVLVVDDGSSDDTPARAACFRAKVIETGGRRGPGFARNRGAGEASGDIVFFLDSDVCVRTGTVERIRSSFASDPSLDAIIGSYDRRPRSSDFLSQYRNLMHTFVHQMGDTSASTFWSGCGAIRREVFLALGGFDESRTRPAIEDIELGYRLTLSGHKIRLDRDLQVTHLKQWTLWKIVKTDILDRGIPWTELILRRHFMPDDLNLRVSQRVSAVAAMLMAALTGVLIVQRGAAMLIPLLAIVFFMLSGWWGEIRNLVRPWRAMALLGCFVVSVAAAALWHGMDALALALMLSPVFIVIQRPDSVGETSYGWRYWLSAAHVTGCLGIAITSLPEEKLVLLWMGLVALLGILNRGFYLFLLQERRIPFMLAAMPLHFFYHFYNGISFLAGLWRHTWSLLRRRVTGMDQLESQLTDFPAADAGNCQGDNPE